MKLLIAAIAASAAAVLGMPVAYAGPGQECNLQDKLLCMGPGAVTWCPDDGGHMVGWMDNCPSITFGRWPVGSVEPAR